MVKLLENTFRTVNIGLVNEIALMCGRMDIMSGRSSRPPARSRSASCRFILAQAWADTASPSTRFICPGKPGKRIRGRFIELAGYINGQMPMFVVEKVPMPLTREAGSRARGFIFWEWRTRRT